MLNELKLESGVNSSLLNQGYSAAGESASVIRGKGIGNENETTEQKHALKYWWIACQRVVHLKSRHHHQ